ncbi:MAG TPA: GHMP kinase [Actinomycetota bacterium]|jgi:D-glycero-alpha-D-manno-heptose-7-phosphate kinase|nr:GHMP kinase [Actinomycetota bacterium]
MASAASEQQADGQIEAVAPLRVSFVGGGTDFPHWYGEHGGAVLSATIDHVVRVRVTERPDRVVAVRSLDLDRLVAYHLDDGPVYDGALDLVKAAIERAGVEVGVDVEIRSEAPPGSGLGGSSALVTAVVAALALLGGRGLTAHALADTAYRIEREDLRIAGGWQDQYAAAFGGCNLLVFSRSGVRVQPVADADRLAALAQGLLLCYTGHVRRNVGLIDRQIALHAEGREETILGMKRLQEMAYAMRDAVERVDLSAVGSLLHDAFVAKQQMNPYIAEDTPIESMLAAARDAGAYGGKVCGAGGGGYLLVAAIPEVQPKVRSALEAMGAEFAPFAFAPSGVRATRGEVIWTPAS